MADRGLAALFGRLFAMLASDPTEQHKQWAREIWTYTHMFDFSPNQMRCDEALLALNLARKGVDPPFPNDGEVVIYERDG